MTVAEPRDQTPMTEKDVALIRRVADYIIGGGGKRLRPALLVLSARACGYRGTHHHELAAVIEFIHTATLLHDDVVDESALRRGQATANAQFGNAAAVLVGDFVYSRAFQMMVSVNRMRVLEVLADATNVIAEGGKVCLGEADALLERGVKQVYFDFVSPAADIKPSMRPDRCRGGRSGAPVAERSSARPSAGIVPKA